MIQLPFKLTSIISNSYTVKLFSCLEKARCVNKYNLNKNFYIISTFVLSYHRGHSYNVTNNPDQKAF